ncbi:MULTISPECIES: tRNA1(Val) (adenine(37)-N6)-methyltransferase [unclassified Butyrivibrio]|uniref:tRNA1(Val) (adenine(37)-N6)-methyltransferase n=1 Tax=unclassified Butyrivibrio TaxID=2639466 RepID=UPI0003B46741|nr:MULTISPECIES: tRNA1(Val) (adenine(37)-N6)-methyltransferase [unclassified Butyrivibrio]SDB20262.1 tRNA1Val (adenine37-N6)-methyltransferase [Butyrivibrio sp. INlla16]SEL58861.1 tRNA1Val (adenine37-N6)-methyltransferase [Butyrivibrio sp. ob235]
MENSKTNEFFLKPGERLDDLQRNELMIIQDPERFCFGMDAVLLSGFATATKGDRVLDLGTGTGIIPLLMSAKTDAEELIGLEIQEDSADMARRSVCYNKLQDRVRIVCGDIKEAEKIFEPASFDVVTTNPPYMIKGHGLTNPDSPKAIARHEVLCDLKDVMRAAKIMLHPGGKFFMVHRPFRLAEILACMQENRIEPKRIRMVHPYIDKEPSMVLIEGARDGKPRLSVDPPLIIYDEPGKYGREMVENYGF